MQKEIYDLSGVLRKAGVMKKYAGCLSVKGNYREKNQDRACCLSSSKKGTLFAVGCVCDGIGSFSQSEIAAEMIRDGIERWFYGIVDLYPEKIDAETVLDDLDMTIRELNELIWTYRREKGIDIGCTMSILVLLDENYHVFHVGDSKILLIDDRVLQITKDEVSVVERDGKLKTLLANFMGKADELWMNQSNGNLSPGATFLVGSDGLFKRLREDILFETIRRKNVQSDTEAEEVLKYLIRHVMEMGEKDNISGVLIRIA